MTQVTTGRMALNTLWLVTAVSVPLSVRLFLPSIGTEIIFPAEPLLGLLSLFVVIKWLRSPAPWDELRSTFRTTVARLASAWVLIHIYSAIFSTDPMASWKAVVVQSVYVIALLAIPISGSGGHATVWNVRWNWHDAAFLLVVTSTLTASAIHGLDRMAVNFAPFPFYKDHTLYAAVLSFVLFHVLAKVDDALNERSIRIRTTTLILLLVGLSGALVLSYGRGAWMGTFLALLLYGVLGLPRRWSILLVSTSVVLVLLALFGAPLAGRPQSHASQLHGTGPLRTLRSFTNTTGDSNNIDRLIRWKASIRMFRHAPLTGLGAGTWQDRFEHYITPEERGRISGDFVLDDTKWAPAFGVGSAIRLRDHAGNIPGNFGSAHSEYLLALSETGLFGGLWWLVVVLLVVHHTCRALLRGRQDLRYTLIWCSGLALCAYLTHAFFNNFLDDCKAAFLFWPSLAILCSETFRTPPTPAAPPPSA